MAGGNLEAEAGEPYVDCPSSAGFSVEWDELYILLLHAFEVPHRISVVDLEKLLGWVRLSWGSREAQLDGVTRFYKAMQSDKPEIELQDFCLYGLVAAIWASERLGFMLPEADQSSLEAIDRLFDRLP